MFVSLLYYLLFCVFLLLPRLVAEGHLERAVEDLDIETTVRNMFQR